MIKHFREKVPKDSDIRRVIRYMKTIDKNKSYQHYKDGHLHETVSGFNEWPWLMIEKKIEKKYSYVNQNEENKHQ